MLIMTIRADEHKVECIASGANRLLFSPVMLMRGSVENRASTRISGEC